jgi:hypothetical protein
VVCASALLTAIAIFNRKQIVDDIIARGGRVTATDASDDDRARALILAAGAIALLLIVAAGIVTAVWAGRVAKNAVARGALGVNVGMAKAGWFIPIGSWFLGFRELRRSVEGVGGGGGASIQRWQISFIVVSAFGWFSRSAGDDLGSLAELRDYLSTQFGLALLTFVLYLVAMYMATKAIHEVDTAVSPA